MILLFEITILSISCKGNTQNDKSEFLTNLEETDLFNNYAPIKKSSVYRVFVNGKEVDVWRELCYDKDLEGGKTYFHTVRFEYFAGAQVEIFSSVAFTDYVLSPKRFNIDAEKCGNKLTFTIPAYFNYSLAIPGQEPLLLFGAPNLSEYKTSAVVVFERGIHHAPNGVFEFKSNTTYYLEEGAILNGKVLIENASNVKIIGRGYIDDRTSATDGNFIRVYNSKNIELKGFGVRHEAQGWQVDMVNSSNVQVSYLNLLSFGLNNDGLDLGTGCSDVHIEHCFVGSGDDGFGWHATNAAKDGEQPLTNCSALNCMVWKGKVGHGIRIGSSLETKEVSNLFFKNIDIVRIVGGYAVVIPNSDWAEVKDLTFEGIRDEKPNQTAFVSLSIEKSQFSNPVYRPGTISNIQFVDCESNGTKTKIKGYDKDHMIKNVTFKNVKLGGRKMQQSDIEMNEFTENIVVFTTIRNFRN